MGCVIVSGVALNAGHVLSAAQIGEIVLCTINTSLFGAYRSDCHAEANAVANCAAGAIGLRGHSCYVTRAPCTACYKLLASAGVRRIVSPQQLDSADCSASAAALGIETIVCRDNPTRSARRESLGHAHEDMDRVKALREERKRLRAEKSFGKKAIRKHVSSLEPSPMASAGALDGTTSTSDAASDGAAKLSTGDVVE